MMTTELLEQRFAPVLDDIESRASVAGRFVDKNVYQLYVATLWANVVLNPEEAGIDEADLEVLHALLNARVRGVLGEEADVTACFRFVNSKAGERAMNDAQLGKTHRDLLLYFSSMILDPDGHRRWMEDVQSQENRDR